MRGKYLWLFVCLLALAASEVLAQCGPQGCPGGVCPQQQFYRGPMEMRPPNPTPSEPQPAFVYARPTAHRAAVVRIEAYGDAARRPWLGSGVIVRVGGRICIVTAKHVVARAKRIAVRLHNGKQVAASVVKYDPAFDLAVLAADLPADVEAAELGTREDVPQKPGDACESCGYGPPETRLACSYGRLLAYQNLDEYPAGPADVMEVSGPVRDGDSGGPIFNSRGRVVGIISQFRHNQRQRLAIRGTQAGRVGVLVNAAITTGRIPTVATPKRVQVIVEGVPPLSDEAPPMPVEPAYDLPLPIPAEPALPAVESDDAAAVPQDAFGRCQILKNRRPPNPTPSSTSVVVQSDPAVLRSLTAIERNTQVLVGQSHSQADVRAITKDEHALAAHPLAVVLTALAAVVVGLVVWFAILKQ